MTLSETLNKLRRKRALAYWCTAAIQLVASNLSIALLLFVRQIIGVFQVMEQPLTMTGGGPNGATESLTLLAYKYAFDYFRFDKGMATGVMTFLILVCTLRKASVPIQISGKIQLHFQNDDEDQNPQWNPFHQIY